MKAKLLNTEKDLNKLGASIAQSVVSIDKAYNANRINLFLDVAKQYSNDELKTKHILQGYYNQFIEILGNKSDAMARARKSEFKAVFDAVGATLVSGVNADKLSQASDYHSFIKLARELRDVGKDKTPKAVNVKPLNDNQVASIKDNLKRADVDSSVSIVNDIVSNLAQFSDNDALAGVRQVRLINNICNTMLAIKTLDKATVKLAETIQELTAKHLDKVAISEVESVGGVYDVVNAKAVNE